MIFPWKFLSGPLPGQCHQHKSPQASARKQWEVKAHHLTGQKLNQWSHDVNIYGPVPETTKYNLRDLIQNLAKMNSHVF